MRGLLQRLTCALLWRRHWLWPALVLICAGVFFFKGLTLPQLQKSDEALYASAALEMSRSGELLYPTGYFAKYTTVGKPPGALWPMVATISVLGQSKLAVRLPTALAGVLVVLLLYLLATELVRTRWAGLCAALLALAQSGWVSLGRVVWLEDTLTAVFLLAIWLASRARIEPRGGRRLVLQLACGLAIGYDAWVKHAVGFAGLGAVGLATLVAEPDLLLRPRRLLERLGVITGSALGFFGIWLGAFLLDRGGGEVLHQINAKLAAEKSIPRKAGDVWATLTRFVEPWVVVAGLVGLVALLAWMLWRQPRPALRARHRQQAFVLVALLGLVACHLYVFGSLSDKLRAWYFIPVFPLLALGAGAPLGALISRAAPRLQIIALPILTCGLIARLSDSSRWTTGFVVILAVLLLGLTLALVWDRLREIPWVAAALCCPLLRAAPRVVVGLLIMGLLAQGLWRSSKEVFKEPRHDFFADYQAEWKNNPPPQLYVDAEAWARPRYFKPTLYFYYSPLKMVPHDMMPPCDLSDLKAGDYALIHWKKWACAAPRATQMRQVTRWWRLFKLR